MIIVKIFEKRWIDSRKHEDRLLTRCRKLEQKDRHDWLTDWLDEQENRQLIVIVANSLFLSKRISHSGDFLFTRVFLRVVDDFLLTRVFLRAIWRFSFKHSRIFTSDEDFVFTRFFHEQLTIFFNLAYFYEIDDFI